MSDYCDACGPHVNAYVRYERIRPETGNVDRLTLCGHHATRHHDAMTSQGWLKTSDTRNEINVKAGASV